MDTGTNRSHLKTAALIAVWLAVLAALLWYRHHRHVNPDPQCDESPLAKGTHYDRDAYPCKESK